MTKTDSKHRATRRTVLIAGAANVVVGLTKLTAGILSGSSAMLAEAAHSAADTLNQGFLLASVHQGDRPADPEHQFGHGQERYFWSLLAAFGIFVAGGGFSIFEGILSLTRTRSESPAIAYAALAIAFAAEGASFIRAYRQVRGEARNEDRTILSHMETSPDTTVKTALFEDSAALIGLVFAAVGVGLRQLTGSPAWDGGASIAIGILLIVVAAKLGLNSKDLLIGRAADPRDQDLIRDQIEGMPGVDRLLELQTMHVGPDSLIVAARVALDDAITADQAEDLAGEIDRRLAHRLPQDLHVFVDPTQTARGERASPH